MTLYRHMHIYAAASIGRDANWEAMGEPFVPRSSYSEKKNTERKQELEDQWAGAAYEHLHTAFIQHFRMVILDFLSSERDTDYAVPDVAAMNASQKPLGFNLAVSDNNTPAGQLGYSVAMTWQQAEDMSVHNMYSIYPENISLRSAAPDFLKRLIRIEAMRTGLLRNLEMPLHPKFFLKLSSLGWNALLGPENLRIGDHLQKSLPLSKAASGEKAVDVQLRMTLELFQLAGLIRGNIKIEN